MKVSLLTPTLNEIEAAKIVLPKLNKSWVDEIIVVDGGSTDGTIEFCRGLGFKVFSQKGRGYGTGMKEAMESAEGDYILEFQPDGNSIPEKIPELVAKIKEGYDYVAASRYGSGAKSYDDDILTAVGNKIFTFIVNFLFGSSHTDVLTGFRVYRKSVLKSLNMDATGLDWSIQMPIKFAKGKFRVAEIGADEPKRVGGKRKMKPFKTGVMLLRVIIKESLSR